MAIEITIEVDHYRLARVEGRSTVLLQSPVSPERQPGNGILVRQDQGEYKNEVSFKRAAQVKKVSRGYHSTHAHGVLIKSSPDREHLKGDRVWLTETVREDRNVPVKNQTNINAVNLRTWMPINVALGDVCWIPKLRKMDCVEDEEELLTISGPPVRKHNRKLYLLAIVQQLRLNNGTTSVEKVELREIVEQDSFKYRNLTALPDGNRQISELFHRSLASVAELTSFEMEFQRSTTNPSNAAMPQVGRASSQTISVATPPPEEEPTEGEDEHEPDVRRKMREFKRRVETKKARRRKPLIPAVPAPEDICNLGERCPTPPRVFFHTNRPSLENPYPRHYHRPDHECPIRGGHVVHCIFRVLEGRNVPDKRLCIVPATVKHHCCETNARPANKQFRRRPEMIEGGQGSVQVTDGRGTLSVVSGREQELEQLCGVPVEVRPVPFVPERDLDELGWYLYGRNKKKIGGLVEGGGSSSRPPPGDYTSDCDGKDDTAAGQCQLHAVPGLSREHQQIHEGRRCVQAGASPGRSPSAPGSTASRPIILEGEDVDEEETDVFGDRHCCGDDDFDREMELYD